MSDETTTIEIRKDGPLVVKNLKTLILSDGTKAEEKTMTVLCRCGMSQNKPYCDGSHKANGWTDG